MIPPVATRRMKPRSTLVRRRSRPGTMPCGRSWGSPPRVGDSAGASAAAGTSSRGSEEVMTWAYPHWTMHGPGLTRMLHRVTEHGETLSPGELQAALSNAIVRIMRDFYGKGAARSRTTIFDEYVFVILEDVLTTAEMTLRDGGAGELVRKVRMRFEDVMTAAFVDEVERLTGRTVVAYHSQVVLEPPSCFEIFVLDPTQAGIGSPGRVGESVEAGDLQPPGHVGDVDELPSPGERSAPREATQGGAAHPTGSAVRAAISNAVMRLTNELYGRGAARARTFVTDEHVFCALEGGLTAVERTLVEAGETELVRELRTR